MYCTMPYAMALGARHKTQITSSHMKICLHACVSPQEERERIDCHRHERNKGKGREREWVLRFYYVQATIAAKI